MVSGYYSPLSQTEVEQIHRAALRVLEEVGVQVESPELLSTLGEFGGRVDDNAQRVRFPAPWVEQFINDSDKYDWSRQQPTFSTFAGIYQCLYLNPESNRLEPFTEQTFGDYICLGRALGEIGMTNLGLPFQVEGIPSAYAPLSEKLYGWKYGARPSGTLQVTGLCPYLVEIYERYAQETGRTLPQVFQACGFLISPLRLARPECDQLLFFHSKGLHMNIGHLISLGGSAPITVAGTAVLNLAEGLFLNILHRALWGGRHLGLGSSVMVMDLRTVASLYGRPEGPMVNAVLGQVARLYGVSCTSQAGLTDSREPSAQAGMQKALSAAAGLCSCGHSSIDAGLLAVDVICSPEQLIYDAELAGALRRMMNPIEVTEESCAVEEIKEVGPGGSFMGTDLTARRFRHEVWQPTVWSRDTLQDWLQAGAPTDQARAKTRLRELLAAAPHEPLLSEACERDLRAIITRAVQVGAAD